MELFCTEEKLVEQRRLARRYAFCFGGLWLLTAALFILFCLMTRTGNAALMFRLAMLSVIPLGLACIAVYVCLLSPARLRLTHLEGLVNAVTAEHEGRFFLSAEAFQIPKSVRVRRVRLEGGEEPLRLNLDEAWVSRAPAGGSLVRLRTVRKFITGIEVLAPPENPAPAEAGSARRKKSVRPYVFRLLPLFILWGMMAPILGGFVFTRITDTDAAHKVTLYVDAELRDAASLAARLEECLAAPLRMVKVHPFTYALFGSDALKQADLYIVPLSHTGEYAEWFAPVPEELSALAAGETPDGIPVFDPASGLSVASSWILYTGPSGEAEPYRLYFGRQSFHLADHAAAGTAAALLALTD